MCSQLKTFWDLADGDVSPQLPAWQGSNSPLRELQQLPVQGMGQVAFQLGGQLFALHRM